MNQCRAVKPPSAKLSQEKRALIANAINRGETVESISHWLRVDSTTVKSLREQLEGIRRRSKTSGLQGNRKLDERHVQELVKLLEINPELTVRDLHAELLLRFPELDAGKATVSRALDKQLITLRHPDVDTSAAGASPQGARQFSVWFAGAVQTCDIVFLEEIGFHLWTRSSEMIHGRLVKSQGIRRLQNVQVTATLAVSPTLGLLHRQAVCQMLTLDSRREALLATLLSAARVSNGRRLCLLASSTSHADLARQLLDEPPSNSSSPEAGLRQLLPALNLRQRCFVASLPASARAAAASDLGPLTAALASLKSSVRRRISSKAVQQELHKLPPGCSRDISLHHWRLLVLQRVVEESLAANVTPQACRQWCSDAMTRITQLLLSSSSLSTSSSSPSGNS